MNENEILKPTNTDAPKSVMAASAGGRRVVSAKSKKKGKDATSLSPSTAKLQPQSKKAAGTKSQRKWDENGIATEHDMAVPKRKTTPSKRGMRRSADALSAPTYVTDKNSGELRRPHHIDLKTGVYRGRQVLKAQD